MSSPSISLFDESLRSHEVVELLADALARADSFTFADHLPLLERVVRSSLPMDALKLALRRVREDVGYQLPRFVMEGPIRGWTVLDTEQFALSVGVRRAPRRPQAVAPPVRFGKASCIQPYGFDLFIGFLRLDDIDLGLFEVEPPADGAELPTLKATGVRSVRSGDTVFMRAGVDASICSIYGPLVYAEVTSKPKVRLLPQFDPRTLAFNGWISGDQMACRIELLTRTLAEFGCDDSAPLVASLAAHHDHFVRWNSVRHLLRLDADRGAEQVRVAMRDPHPDVRLAAAETLALIESPALHAQEG